jgi:plastocyanin
MKYLIIAIVLVILIGGGYFLVKGNHTTQQQSTPSSSQSTQQNTQPSSMQKQTSASPSANSSSNAVSFTANGFEPHSVTIKVGQTVTWTNKSSDDLWVASNPHPTHTDYPGFDELKSMPTGQTYSFTFTKVGNWGYHDHLNPSQMGVVVVTQ